MAMKKTRVALAVAHACGALALATAGQAAFAQEAKVERVEVTGSSIKRIAAEGALPVQVISKEEIVKSGVTSTADLIQNIPAMQGFTTSSDSVGGSGGGIQTASIHDIGEEYTLVLLNGRRLAPRGSGSTVDLNSIPLSAIERVEVLTDGASALYGSDAIAGVVNFILRDNFSGVEISAREDSPQHKGGKSGSFSVTAGFGDFGKDGYNILLSAAHDDRDELLAKDRDFANTGIISFNYKGQDLYFFNGSGNAIPGNARIRYVDANGVTKQRTFNPYYAKNGACAPDNSYLLGECFFDYTSTVRISPENSRDSLYTRGKFRINDTWTASLDAAYSDFHMITRIAPYPTGYFNLPMSSQLVKDWVLPYLSTQEKATLNRVQARWRGLPTGNRTTEWNTKSTHLVGSVDGQLAGWDVNAALTYSKNDTDQAYPDGWLLAAPFLSLIGTGTVNVFDTPDKLTESAKQALRGTVYNGPWDNESTVMKAIEFKASRPVFNLAGGSAYFGAGVDFRNYDYDRTVAPANANEEILFLSKDDPYGLKRKTSGLYGELVMPFLKGLEVTASLRYDTLGAVTDTLSGDKINKDESDTTYKISARYQPTSQLLVRGSVGTGFKSPSMLDIGRPRADFGVTSATYSCPFAANDPLAQYCLPGKFQAQVWNEGNANLKPELSDQRSIGFVFAASSKINMSMDWWQVKLKDAISSLTDAQIFADPVAFRDLFTYKDNNATGDRELAIIRTSVNIGQVHNEGIDWTLSYKDKFGFGALGLNLAGTHLLKSKYTRPGTRDEWVSSLGKYGENENVSFKNVFTFNTNLKHGDFEHNLTAKYRSGYQDQYYSEDDCVVTEVDAFGDCVEWKHQIASYTTWDWQTAYNFSKTATVRFGINNLLDKEPHFSLRTGNPGHQLGYDPRYTDPLGRTYYVSANFKF